MNATAFLSACLCLLPIGASWCCKLCKPRSMMAPTSPTSTSGVKPDAPRKVWNARTTLLSTGVLASASCVSKNVVTSAKSSLVSSIKIWHSMSSSSFAGLLGVVRDINWPACSTRLSASWAGLVFLAVLFSWVLFASWMTSSLSISWPDKCCADGFVKTGSDTNPLSSNDCQPTSIRLSISPSLISVSLSKSSLTSSIR